MLKVWPIDHINQVICGDCLEVLRAMPDESVNCCITSPPYWGLRDYGTAKWVGGDENCDHIETLNKHGGQRANRNQNGYKKLYMDICKICGAKRIDSQFGLEKTPEEYVAKLVEVFREVRRVLRKDGTLWLNLGDSYAGSNGTGGNPGDKQWTQPGSRQKSRPNIPQNLKPKDLVGIPWRVAFALQADGWYLRQDIIWHKPNPMPESVTDRCTKAHEYVFLLSKNAKYYYDGGAIGEPLSVAPHRPGNNLHSDKISGPNDRGGHSQWEDTKERTWCKSGYRNRRSVWTVTTKPSKEAHFAMFPPDLIEPMVLAGCPEGGIILDPFMGAGTTGMVAKQNYRNYIGIELNEKYIEMAQKRIDSTLVNKKLEFGGET